MVDAMTDDEPLTPRRLNRALLARQLLLERAPLDPAAITGRLVGLQAQQPAPPFVGLWSRTAGLQRADVLAALAERRIVRGTAVRGTIHWLRREDYVAFRWTLQPVLDRVLQAPARARILRLDGLLDHARELLAAEPRTIAELREPLAARWPDHPPADLAMVVRMRLPLLMVPEPGHPNGFPANARFALAEELLGQPLDRRGRGAELLRRYLAAFGPATAADAATWSGLTGTRELLSAVPDLVVLRDERGRELLDLADAPRPPEDAPAPVRFLPEFDNAILSHADRTRVIADEHRGGLVTRNGIVAATVLWDGRVAAVWRTARRRSTTTLEVAPLRRLPRRALPSIRAEGRRLLAFLAPDDEHRVEIA